MTEKQLVELGFEKHEDFDGLDSFYYYTLTIARGFEFITNANDECDHDDDWFVEFFESDPTMRWRNAADLKLVIAAINTGEKVK